MNGSRTWPWLLAWLLALAAAILLTVLIETGWLPDETEAVIEVQGWAVPGQFVSDVVRAATTTPFVLAFGIVLAVLHWLSGDHRATLVLVVMLVAFPLVQAGLKELVDRPRPFGGGIEPRADASSASFPAGHVMSPSVVYGWLLAYAVLSSRPWVGLRFAALAWAVSLLGLTGIVNLYLGVHWPTDVAGGYLWGAVLLLPAIYLWLTGPGVLSRLSGGRP
jgi:membrane-associated phospholipid phosphatase